MHNVALFTVQCMRMSSSSMTMEISYVGFPTALQANAALEQLLKAQYKDAKLVGDEIVLYRNTRSKRPPGSYAFE
jgi:hypothetical protein